MPSRARSSAVLAAAALCLLTPSLARAPEITLLYDTEFGGYVPVVGGIERPDLVIKGGDGRAPESARKAMRLARRGVKRSEFPEVTPPAVPPRPGEGTRKLSRRWRRKTAITTEFLVLDTEGHPVENARVYRYIDPSFYPVNQDGTGARLFGTWRLLPMPLPPAAAIATVRAYDLYWAATGTDIVGEITPNIDIDHNPWTRGALTGMPAIEFLGTTDLNGMYRAMTGVFNLRDERRFPRAVVPDALRIGFVVVADGFQPASTERRHIKGGSVESRTLQLLDAPDRALFTSGEWRAASRMLAAQPLDPRGTDDVAPEIAHTLETLTVALAGVPAEAREAARHEAAARLWEIMGQRLGLAQQLAVARRALAETPESTVRAFRVAELLAEGGDLAPIPPKTPVPPTGTLAEAERLATGVAERDPRFAPAFRLLDRLLVQRGAPADERRRWVERLLHETPFDAWGRARMAALLLKAGRDADAFDHLRYTYMAQPGIGGDRELALALSAYYWRIGLPEKAGAYAWLLTGRVPEDPGVRPRFVK